MKVYQHLFFDLDRTLWDFEANSLLTLKEIFVEKELAQRGIPNFEEFLNYYKPYNLHLWSLYKYRKIEKKHLSVQRFRGTLEYFNIMDDHLANEIAKDYVRISPTKTKLFPHTIDVLSKLSKKYQLHIITNGFNEVQFVKLENSGLMPFFKHIITSEMIGIQKPNPEIFEFSLEKAGAKMENSIMIGDDQDSDIFGAMSFGMDQVFVDYHHEELKNKPTYHIHELTELLKIFL
ncbi:MAG: noncanonical pyrimidine nucleotidase, YjjG family [Bacteroidales bacterium]|nr:noncanonical pyrimidine nucleotidase, YjjG family [Bacteroidales bacterium]